MMKKQNRSKTELFRLLKFSGCSTLAWLVDFALFSLLYEYFAFYYIAAKAFSYTAGAVTSYTLNRWVTFRTQTKYISRTLCKFIAVNCISISFSLASMYLFSDLLSVGVWISYFLSILFSFSSNYLGNKFWVFRHHKTH